MKTLKFDHALANLIAEGKKNSTWRIYDDKNLQVNDLINIIDKVKEDDPASWKVIGQAKIAEVVEKRLEDIAEKDLTQDHAYATKKDMLKHFQHYYGKRVDGSTAVKIIYFDLDHTANEMSAGIFLEEAKLYTDGGSRGNPGPSSAAFVICKMDDTVVEKSGFFMGTSTNNQAEYQGLRLGLEKARELGIRKLHVYMDSQLVVNQINGLYKVKNADLAPVFEEAKALLKLFEEADVSYIPRELNKLADKEVNRILDQQKVL